MTLRLEVGLRPKNQITVPEPALRRLNAQVGDRLILEADDNDVGCLRLRVLRRGYAGALAGVYGTSDEVDAYVRDERSAWQE